MKRPYIQTDNKQYMNEQVYLVVKVLFFNISIPVYTVRHAEHTDGIEARNVHVSSKIEYLTEQGSVTRRHSEAALAVERLYVRGWGLHKAVAQWLYGQKGSSARENTIFGVLGDGDGSSKDTSMYIGKGPGAIRTEKPEKEAATRQRPENGDASTAAKDRSDKGRSGTTKNAKNVVVSTSDASYAILKILTWLGSPVKSLVYEYSEFEQIPLMLQIFFHIPLLLTGLIVFVIVLTLDPDMNNTIIKNEIDKLPMLRYTKDMALQDCPVCIDAFSEGQEVRVLGCNHSFHRECIDAWLMNSLKCPICRAPVSNHTRSPSYEAYQTYYFV